MIIVVLSAFRTSVGIFVGTWAEDVCLKLKVIPLEVSRHKCMCGGRGRGVAKRKKERTT